MHQWKNEIQNKYQFRNTQLKKIEKKIRIKYSHKTLQYINRKREYKTHAILETLNNNNNNHNNHNNNGIK